MDAELPFLDLFTRLKDAGLPLGIGEYHLLLRALQGGFGATDKSSLKRLCQALWVKSPEENRLFEHHFQRIMTQILQEKVFTQSKQESAKLKGPISPKEPQTEQATTSDTPSPTPDFGMVETFDDEVQVAQAIKAANIDDEIVDRPFLLTSDYFPVTRRQMKQSWRYLRRPVREGPATELDLEATIAQFGQQGVLIEPVLVPRRVNRIELLLLVDQDGSMVPFHTLSHRLAETAMRGGRLGSTNTYYFHNCPDGYLYHDPYLLEATTVSELLMRQKAERAVVLIFSDAGAARGGLNQERLALTQRFLHQLKQRIRYIAWLNPMPRSRWQRTTAAAIACQVPMFEVNRQGLDRAIDVLRGKHTGVIDKIELSSGR